MKPLRNGDLTDAAELIDSAQGCAKLLAKCCAEKDAEIDALQRRGLEKSRLLCEALEREKRLRELLRMVRDKYKFEANSEGGIVHRIDDELAREGR